MKNKKNFNKKTLIIISIVLVLGLVIFFAFNNKDKYKSLLCEQLESNEQAKLSTKVLINKNGKNLHLNYTGTIEFLTNNEFAQNALSIFVKNQVSTLKELDDVIATFDEVENKITYEFDFNMNSSIESEIKDLVGIYSSNIEELKEHFESGGAICEEV